MIQYTIEAAVQSRCLSKVFLTTDDERIAGIGRKLGVDVPFIRPEHLARDDTPMLPVIQHAVETLSNDGFYFDAICLLQPSTPIRRPGDICSCIELLDNSGADSVVTVLPVPLEYNPHWVYFKTCDGFLELSTGETEPIHRRQELPTALHREGSIYVTRTSVVMERNSLYGNRLIGFPMDPETSVNIDTQSDWCRAERLLARRT